MTINSFNNDPSISMIQTFEIEKQQSSILKGATFTLDEGFYYGTKVINVAKAGFDLDKAMNYSADVEWDEGCLSNDEYSEYFGFSREELIEAFNSVSNKYKIASASNDFSSWMAICPLAKNSDEYEVVVHHLVNDLGMIYKVRVQIPLCE